MFLYGYIYILFKHVHIETATPKSTIELNTLVPFSKPTACKAKIQLGRLNNRLILSLFTREYANNTET